MLARSEGDACEVRPVREHVVDVARRAPRIAPELRGWASAREAERYTGVSWGCQSRDGRDRVDLDPGAERQRRHLHRRACRPRLAQDPGIDRVEAWELPHVDQKHADAQQAREAAAGL